MKKLLLIGLALFISFGVSAQQHAKHAYNPLKNVSVKKPAMKAIDESTNFLAAKPNQTVKSGLIISESNVGTSRYDLQTNGATQNRIYLHSDGTIGATWTMGLVDPGFTDRGAGYNYYDGSAWGPSPTARIEDVKTGWPSYQPCGANGEIVVTHMGTVSGLKVSKRDTKGTGAWNWSALVGPASVPELLWPRMVTSGTNHNYVHVASLTAPVANGGTVYNGQDGSLMYNRSSDGGVTWDIQNVQFPQSDTNISYGLSGDNYAWAQPRGNTIAFVYGDNWENISLWKSTDNGANWTKTTIFQHPYPKFKETTTLVTDTPYVCDGGITCAIDPSGNVHVAFGLMRVLNDDLTDGTTSFFPYTDALVYWKEGDAPFATLNIDQLYADNKVIASTPDLNGNDTIFEYVAIGTYYLSITGMPNMAIDDDGKVYVFYTTVMEHMDNGVENYRHVWARAKVDGIWKDAVNINSSIVHNFDECIFPSVSPTTDANVYIIYQADEEPGMAVRGSTPADPYTDNSQIVVKIPKPDLTIIGIKDQPAPLAYVSQNIPNPTNGTTMFRVSLMKPTTLSVEVMNSVGQKVFEIPASAAGAGTHEFTLDVSKFEAGLYFYTVSAGGNKVTKKMIVQ